MVGSNLIRSIQEYCTGRVFLLILYINKHNMQTINNKYIIYHILHLSDNNYYSFDY